MPITIEKKELFRQFACIGNALASPRRLRLISLLTHGVKPVEELARLTSQSMAATSSRLKYCAHLALS